MRTDRYTGVAIALHWLLAALILGQIAFGWYLQKVPRKTPERTVYVNLHKSTGLTLGLLILVRVGWRLTHKAPPLPSSLTWPNAAVRAVAINTTDGPRAVEWSEPEAQASHLVQPAVVSRAGWGAGRCARRIAAIPRRARGAA